MATKVSNLPEKTTLSSTDIIYVVKDGLSGKITVANAATAFANSLALLITNNLSDLGDASVARTNIGLNTTENQTDSVNKRFMSDAQETILNNTSNTNTGDQNAASVVLDDTDLVVVPVTDLQAFADGIDSAILKDRSTGVTSSYVSSVSVGGTTFAQPAVEGEIKSDEGYFSISYAGATGITVSDLTVSSTYVYLDNAGALQQQITTPTRQDWSRKIFTMRIGVNTSTNTIIGFEYLNNPVGHYSNSIRDLYEYLLLQGIPFKADQVITGRATDLGFNVSAGTLLEYGGTGDINNANIRPYDQADNVSYNLMSRTALVSSETNLVKFWDNAGTITALGSTTLVGHRLYRFSSGNFAMQYGQGNYANMDLAKAGVLTEEYVLNPVLKDATFFGWWFIESTATNTGGTTLTDFIEYTIGVQGGSSSSLSGALLKGNNLSDLLDAATARTNLGVAATSESYSEIGTALGGDLIVKIGDYNNLAQGFSLTIDDSDESVLIKTGGLIESKLSFDATTNRDYSFPDKDGTIALTSDLDDYLLNTTDTFTGDLTVTGDVSAVNGDFSGDVDIIPTNSNLALSVSNPTNTQFFDGLKVNVANISQDTRIAYFTANLVDKFVLWGDGNADFYGDVDITGNLTANNADFSGDVLAESTYARASFGQQGGSGDVHFGSSGAASPSVGNQDYGFYSAHNAYRSSTGAWKHSRTSSIGAVRILGSGGGSSGNTGFSFDYSANNGSSNISWTNLLQITTTGAATFSSDVAIGGDATLVDNGKLLVGTDADLEIYHSGINSYINPKVHQLGSLDIGSTSKAWGQVAFNSTSYTFGDGVSTTFLSLNSTGTSTFSSSVSATQYKIPALNTAPSSATDTGTLGEIRYTADYIYVCTATNTWKRTAIATW